MNKIFKVVWSKVKHCYVVVSEIAKNTISGGARRSRVRKGALAAALVTTIFGSSFVMPNSALAADGDWWAGGGQGGYTNNSMGNSYEALVVLTAAHDKNGKISFGIRLIRGDSSSAQSSNKDANYVQANEITATSTNQLGKEYYDLGLRPISGYAYTEVSSVGANAQFETALQQTIINQIISSVKAGENVSVTPLDNNGDSITDAYSISAVDTKLKTNDITKRDEDNYEEYEGLALNNGNLVLAVKDTAGNVITGSADIGEYIRQVAKNATYITNNDGTEVTIGQQITNLTNTVNAGWIAKIGDTIVKEVKPSSNELSFVAGENVTLENENGAIKINAILNSGGSSEIDLNAGENIKLENNNQNGSITIIADIEGEGYVFDWQQQRLMASAQDDSGQEITGEVDYEGQLTKLRIGNKVYSVPAIAAIENAVDKDPLLRALALDGTAYRVVDKDFRLVGSNKVIDENGNISYTGAYQVTSDENGNNKVELNVYDNYNGVADRIVITGMATQADLNALNFGVIKTTTGTGEETVTTNKLGLVGSDGADLGRGSVEVTTAVGSGGKDATITFGGANGFTLDVGSTVRANVNDIVVSDNTAYLEKISVNGTPYKVLTLTEIKNNIQSDMGTINNLSVSGGEVSKVDNARHGWKVIDSNQKDSNQNDVVYKDTTLYIADSSAKTTSEDGSTNTYKVQDTAGNVVTIDDVASAEYVNEKFNDIEGEIDGLDVRVTAVEKNISQINQNINAAKTEVKAGESGNVTVTTSHDNGENGDGHTIYTIDTKNTVTSVEAGNENITVEPNIDGDNRTYKISAKNTVNSDMSAEWDNDNVIVAVKDSDGNVVSAPIENVAKASDLEQEIEARKDVDSALAGAIISNQQDVQNLNAGLNKLGNRMNKVGAGSAALAALHPMDFDPDDKLQFSAGVGHYGGENAAALGAFYRPTEKVMFSVAGTMGNGEDMVNAGVTFALDKPNNVSNSRVAMAREIQDLRQQVAALTMLVMQMASRDNAALAGVAMFPDVPENHWAYDYIEGLQKQGIIEGYPDGNFGGDRSMTRYEFAAMLYRALEKGFPVDSRLLNEFNAELGRIRVDRIKGADNDANKVERVRVNNYEDRDDYGSKIVQVKAGAQKSVLKTKKDENHLVLVLLIFTF